MTVTELVQDRCQEATRLVANGQRVRVMKRREALFDLVPVKKRAVPKPMSAAVLRRLDKAMTELARHALRNNPITELRALEAKRVADALLR